MGKSKEVVTDMVMVVAKALLKVELLVRHSECWAYPCMECREDYGPWPGALKACIARASSVEFSQNPLGHVELAQFWGRSHY